MPSFLDNLIRKKAAEIRATRAAATKPTTDSAECLHEVSVTDGSPKPPPIPWREILAEWPIEWRMRWGGLANAYARAGLSHRDAEERAFTEVATSGGTSAEMDPDPYTALWRDELSDLIESGEAARHLPPSEADRARALLTEGPLDCEAMRSVVHEVSARMWTERCRDLGVPESPWDDDRWRCLNPYCLDRGRWWMSAHGVINCMNCRPPALPGLVVAEGDAEDAPFVESDRSNQAVVARSVPPGRWRDAFEERAAILEFDGGLPRAVAEVRAFAAVSAELRRDLTGPFPKSESAARVEPTTCTH